MTTIDKLDISVYNLYAIRTRMIEQTNRTLRLDQASVIPPQTTVLDTYPKLSELDLLLGVSKVMTPWAYFLPPKGYKKKGIRRSPFSFSRVAPAFGSREDQEDEEERIIHWETEDEEEKVEKQVILECMRQMEKVNDWLGHIIGRVGQFLQG